MLLCTAGGRENLRTDRELRPSLGEIGKATWLVDNTLEKGTVVFHYYSWVYFKMYSPTENWKGLPKGLEGFQIKQNNSLWSQIVTGNNMLSTQEPNKSEKLNALKQDVRKLQIHSSDFLNTFRFLLFLNFQMWSFFQKLYWHVCRSKTLRSTVAVLWNIFHFCFIGLRDMIAILCHASLPPSLFKMNRNLVI